ncbi:unnamed protein product [Paramecium pentaurelia]|uniref:Uncharacterized protein n=1 Tax=Paramecium pentaurelia TaxID=43138 RepID=A0A8S1YCW8_9CILI|nr:unnamed protein product [Paramecium pentaurelia]
MIITFAYLVNSQVKLVKQQIEYNNTSKCLKCLDTNHELNNISQCVCKSTYYSNGLITCAKCQDPCDECDINRCINCIDINQILDSNKQCIYKSFIYQSQQVLLIYDIQLLQKKKIQLKRRKLCFKLINKDFQYMIILSKIDQQILQQQQ